MIYYSINAIVTKHTSCGFIFIFLSASGNIYLKLCGRFYSRLVLSPTLHLLPLKHVGIRNEGIPPLQLSVCLLPPLNFMYHTAFSHFDYPLIVSIPCTKTVMTNTYSSFPPSNNICHIRPALSGLHRSVVYCTAHVLTLMRLVCLTQMRHQTSLRSVKGTYRVLHQAQKSGHGAPSEGGH